MCPFRCFQVQTDWFAVVPIIEIANHCQNPNAAFALLGSEGYIDYSTPMV